MKASATVFTLFSFQITWLHLCILCGALLALYIVFGLVREKAPRIRLGGAFRDALGVVLGRPADVLKFLLIQFCVMGACLAPMLLMTELPIRYPAAVAGLCWLLLANPARVNAASAMQDSLAGGGVFSLKLAEDAGWGGKVGHGALRAVFLACWGIPLGLGLNYAWRLYKGEDDMDGFRLLQSIQDFGNGDVKAGIRYLLLILGALVLVLLVGFAFHSGARHARALGDPGLVNGHRGKLILGWFCSGLVFMLPMWIALAVAAAQVLPLLNDPNGLLSGTVKMPRMRSMILVLGLGGLLTAPLIPVRSLTVAAMVRRMKDGKGPDAP